MAADHTYAPIMHQFAITIVVVIAMVVVTTGTTTMATVVVKVGTIAGNYSNKASK
jgi:energy-converting hydrogenase Eha subunit B